MATIQCDVVACVPYAWTCADDTDNAQRSRTTDSNDTIFIDGIVGCSRRTCETLWRD